METPIECPFSLEDERKISHFDEVDPFNPQNRVRGIVNRRQGRHYGTLFITHVNNVKWPQIVYATPKLHYPFKKEGTFWEWPEYDEIEIYPKYDGTNVLVYAYTDGTDTYWTAKTRLRPFLGQNSFGNFFDLFQEALKKHSRFWIEAGDPRFNYSFELYGSKNRILVDYPGVDIDVILLFVIEASSGKIFPPWKACADLPQVEQMTYDYMRDDENEIDFYLRVRELMESELEIDEETGKIIGHEGSVWYFIIGDHVEQIKNKPKSILEYHWRGKRTNRADAPTRIPYESIYVTCKNAFENWDDPTVENVKELLLEEFDESDVYRARNQLKKILRQVLWEKKYQFEVLEKYKQLKKKFKTPITDDPAIYMRILATQYGKEDGGNIYRLLTQYEKDNQ